MTGPEYRPIGPNSAQQELVFVLAAVATLLLIPMLVFRLVPKTGLGWLTLVVLIPLAVAVVLAFAAVGRVLHCLLWSIPGLARVRDAIDRREKGREVSLVRIGFMLLVLLPAFATLILINVLVGPPQRWVPRSVQEFVAENFR